jgi:hypothetical protein
MKKIILAELSDIYYWDRFFPLHKHVWGIQLNNDYTGISDPGFELENIGFQSSLDVGSIRVEQVIYNRVDTVDELIIDHTTGTYFYDDASKLLLIKFVDYKPPAYFQEGEIVIGLVLGFYNCPFDGFDGIVNGRQFKPDLLNSPMYKKKLDNVYQQKQVFETGSVVIDNTSRDYSGFSMGYNAKNRAGSFLRTLFWTGSNEEDFNYDDVDVSYQGAVTKIQEGKQMTFTLKDIRSTLNKRSVFNTINNDDYPDMEDGDKVTYIPQIWGKCKRVPCVCLNPTVNAGVESAPYNDYEFLLFDVEKPRLNSNRNITPIPIQEVYIDGDATGLSYTSSTVDVINNKYVTFTIDHEEFMTVDDGDTVSFSGMNNITIDCSGYSLESDDTALIENSSTIIENLLYDTYGYVFGPTSYDVTAWNEFKADAYDIGILQTKPVSVIDEINDIAQTNIGRFIWNQDLKFSMKRYDYEGDIVATISEYEFFPDNYYPDVTQDNTKVLASFRGGCQKRWDITSREDPNGYNWILDDSNEQDALVKHNSTNSKDFPTLINNLTDIADYNSRILTEFSGAIETFTLLLDWEYVNLNEGDWCIINLDTPVFPLYGRVRARIEELQPKVDTAQVTIKFRIFQYFSLEGGALWSEDGTTTENAVWSEDGITIINKTYNEA